MKWVNLQLMRWLEIPGSWVCVSDNISCRFFVIHNFITFTLSISFWKANLYHVVDQNYWNWDWYPSEKLHFPLIWKAADRKWMRANAIVFQRNPSARSARQLQLGCLGTHLLIITHRQMWANRRPVTSALWQSQGQAWLSSAKLLNYLFVIKLKLCWLKHQSVWF